MSCRCQERSSARDRISGDAGLSFKVSKDLSLLEPLQKYSCLIPKTPVLSFDLNIVPATQLANLSCLPLTLTSRISS